MDELVTSFKAQMYEKARSPFLTAFMVSWVSWNLKPIMIFVGSGNIDKKLNLLENLYSDSEEYLGHWVLYPLLSASAFIVLYPIIALIAFSYWNFLNNLIKEIQVSQDDKVPASADSARELRNLVSEISIKKQEVINELVEKNSAQTIQIDTIKGMVATLESEKRDLSKDIEIKELKISELETEITKLQQSATELAEIKTQNLTNSLNAAEHNAQIQTFAASLGIDTNLIPENERANTESLIDIAFQLTKKYKINTEQLKLLILLIISEGTSLQTDIQKRLQVDYIKYTAIIRTLIKKNLLKDTQHTGNYVLISDELKDYAYDSGLLSVPDYKGTLSKMLLLKP